MTAVHTPPLQVGVLISGRGSNLAALIDRAAAGSCPFQISHVISNNPDALGLARAKAAGIATDTVDHRQFANRADFEQSVTQVFRDANVQLVALAGFMRLLTAEFIAGWNGQVVNIHPSLLPAFPGLHSHRQALDAGVRITGCTVHFVNADMDAGPIIAQAAVAVRPEDDERQLAARVLEAEHLLYPSALAMVAEKRVRIQSGRTVFTGGVGTPAQPLLSPSAGRER